MTKDADYAKSKFVKLEAALQYLGLRAKQESFVEYRNLKRRQGKSLQAWNWIKTGEESLTGCNLHV